MIQNLTEGYDFNFLFDEGGGGGEKLNLRAGNIISGFQALSNNVNQKTLHLSRNSVFTGHSQNGLYGRPDLGQESHSLFSLIIHGLAALRLQEHDVACIGY